MAHAASELLEYPDAEVDADPHVVAGAREGLGWTMTLSDGRTDVIPVFPETPKLDDAIAALVALTRHAAQDIDYEIEKLRGYRRMLFEQLAPFKVGDRVRLHRDYKIDPKTSWGWCGYERMMVAGATAKVVKVDCLSSRDGDEMAFTIQVLFDHDVRDSGVNGQTHIREGDARGTFGYWDPARYWEVIS